jgi:hypothetical protein
MITKRNLLCVKKENSLDLGHLLLYKPYKNIVVNFVTLATEKNAIDFDPISRAFDGLESISEEMKHYYEALLGITSYYQHSQGGKGKYVEKKISSVMDTCSMNIKLSELPIWLEYPELHRKKGIFTQSGLTSEEKSILRNIDWNWLGREEETTDVGNLLPNNKLVLIELKNRVDTGGTAGRREIWTKKFKKIVELLGSDTKLYEKDNNKFSLAELLQHFNIKNFEIYIGILFNVEGTPATKEGDKQRGFFSSNTEGFRDLKNFIINNPYLKIERENYEDLFLDLTLRGTTLNIRVGALYGNQISKVLFQKDYSISDLLLLRYDDIWLSQLLAIEERAFLLKYGKNCSIIFKDLLKRDKDLRVKYDRVIMSECREEELTEIVNYLFSKYSSIFEDSIIPKDRDKEEYVADIIQMLCASDA